MLNRVNAAIASILLEIILTTAPAIGADKTYTCTAVKDKAALGIADNQHVSITTSSNVCNFSVGGAAIDSNARQAFLQSMNMLLAGDLDNLGRTQLDTLRHLLLTPTLGTNIDRSTRISFENTVGNSINGIGSCIRSFRSGGDTSFQQPNVFCGTVSPDGARDPLRTILPVTVAGPGRVLEIGVVLDGKGFLLFVPEPLILRGKQGFRFSL